MERYEFNWLGKKNSALNALKHIDKTLRPAIDESVDFDNTKNLFIEGDNLEALKLLQETYLGKVKMIYIDPPYNTGKDFIYRDNFTQNTADYLLESNQKDEEGNRFIANTESNGRFHSDWLSFIYPRLKLARNLLADDGVIFISIDDNEQANLKKLCDEVFGERNFIDSFVIKSNPRGNQAKTHTASEHEYVLSYAKNKIILKPLSFFRSPEEYKKKDELGLYREIGLRKRGAGSRREDAPNQYFPIYYCEKQNQIFTAPSADNLIEILPKLSNGNDGRWRWSKKSVSERTKDLLIRKVRKSDGSELYDVFEKDYFSDEKKSKIKSIIYDKWANYENATESLKELFNGVKVFDYTKPEMLIHHFIKSCSKYNIILDFFAGSSTTAHAVMQLNAEDGGNRKFIMVQLPEKCDEKSESYKAGYKNIAEISKERIRRAGKKILEGECHEGWNKDIGFRVLKIENNN